MDVIVCGVAAVNITAAVGGGGAVAVVGVGATVVAVGQC